MSLRQGLQQGLFTRLRQGLSNFPGGAFPASGAELLVAMGGFGTWTHSWRFSESSGNAIDDIAALALVPANSPTQGAPGAIAGDLAIDFSPDGSTKRCVAAAGTTLDHTTDDFVMFVTFKVMAAVGATRYFAGKVGPTNFWGLQVTSTGTINGVLNDGVTTFNSLCNFNHNDGNWHDVLFMVDRTNNRFKVTSDMGDGTDTDITGAGTSSNTGFFGVGRHASVTGPVAVSHLAHSSVATDFRANDNGIISGFRAYTGR